MKNLCTIVIGAALSLSACAPAPSETAVTLDSAAIAGTSTTTAPRARAAAAVRAAIAVPRDVTIPAGTSLPLTLTSTLASDESQVEDAVTAELTEAITIGGREVVPAGARLTGVVTDVDGAGRVKGRSMLAFRLTSLRTSGRQYTVETAPLSRRGSATKGKDATKIAVGAGVGAALGAVLGGKKGAAQGAAVGGGAGTGLVLATKGEEVRLAAGSDVSTQLTAPVTVRVNAGG